MRFLSFFFWMFFKGQSAPLDSLVYSDTSLSCLPNCEPLAQVGSCSMSNLSFSLCQITEEKTCDCRIDNECPFVQDLIKTRQFLRLNDFKTCGFDGAQRMLCCPSTNLEKEKEIEFRSQSRITEDCGFVIQTKIFGGIESEDHAYPWTVALEYTSKTGDVSVLCGGVLISESHVLTAGHCVQKSNKFVLTSVLVGHSSLKSASRINIKNISLHPDYEKRPIISGDIAVLHIEPLVYSSTLLPICLPDKSTEEEETLYSVVAGWGATPLEHNPDRLREINVVFVSISECQSLYKEVYRRDVIDSSTQICARGEINNTDSCRGDSGSPLMTIRSSSSKWILSGITSFGTLKCDSSLPGVYTNVEYYVDWIRAQMADLSSL